MDKSSKIIGILGAGQLARMSAQAAKQLGHKVHIFSERNEQEPACEFADSVTVGNFNDLDVLKVFAKQCDVITLENEFINSDILKSVNKVCQILPSPESFEKISNKVIEKQTFMQKGIAVTAFQEITNFAELDVYSQLHKYPFMLKASKGGYDGYGNITVRGQEELREAFEKLGGDKGNQLLAERFINLEKEVAIQVVRSESELKLYPICETIQKNHICVEVISPANIEEETKQRIEDYAKRAIEAIDGIGIYAIEFFISKEGQIYLNESAPRPHNSAHYTIEGCKTSQFENHIRSVANMPLGDTELVHPFVVMRNILGTQNNEAKFESENEIPEKCSIHLYGKHTSRIGRKMGHLTVVGKELKEVRKIAKKIEEGIKI